MPVVAFEGPAGTGKTHSLINGLEDAIRRRALRPHERVLALTFMHGSRHRLASRLRGVEALAGQFRAVTLDSFAYHLCRRWRQLSKHLGHAILADDDYDANCDHAARLLSHHVVKNWVSASYPYLVVDEAQDLSSARSGMIRELACTCQVFLAFDEFQCLDSRLRPISVENWLYDVCSPIKLNQCHRTDNSELLAAALAVRDGTTVSLNGKKFSVRATPGPGHYAATSLANFIAWCGGGTVAVLTPSRKGNYANKIVDMVASKAHGDQCNGPYPIKWQQSSEMEHNSLWNDLGIREDCSINGALDQLNKHAELQVVQSIHKWIRRRQSVLGISRITAVEIRRQFDRLMAMRKHHYIRRDPRFIATTIQQAKNREFDHVVIIWPYSVPSDSEQRRRLLYNGITRSIQSCLVLVQHQDLMNVPPFVAANDFALSTTVAEESVSTTTIEQLSLAL